MINRKNCNYDLSCLFHDVEQHISRLSSIANNDIIKCWSGKTKLSFCIEGNHRSRKIKDDDYQVAYCGSHTSIADTPLPGIV